MKTTGMVKRKADGKKCYINTSAFSEVTEKRELRNLKVKTYEDSFEGRRVPRVAE